MIGFDRFCEAQREGKQQVSARSGPSFPSSIRYRASRSIYHYPAGLVLHVPWRNVSQMRSMGNDLSRLFRHELQNSNGIYVRQIVAHNKYFLLSMRSIQSQAVVQLSGTQYFFMERNWPIFSEARCW
jgi:hypothetical protein